MLRIPLRVLVTAAVLITGAAPSWGGEFFDGGYRTADPRRSLEIHRSRLFAPPDFEIEGLSSEATRAVHEEAELRMLRMLITNLDVHPTGVEILEAFLVTPHDPLVESLARSHLAYYYWRTGRFADSQDEIVRLGYLSDWWIVGPFDNERGSGLGRATEVESDLGRGLDLDTRYLGKRQRVGWRHWSEPGLGGMVDLGELLRPNQEALAYLLTHIASEDERDVVLRVGSAGGYAVWLNGSEVGRVDVERRFGFDQDAIVLPLSAGWNRLVIKSTTTRRAWRIRARLTETAGSACPDLLVRAAPPEEAAVVEACRAPTSSPSPSLGAVTLLERAEPTADVMRLDGWLRQRRAAHDEAEHPDRASFLRALEERPEDAVLHHLIASTYAQRIAHEAEREENLWRQSLERALDCDPNFHRASLELAVYHAGRFSNTIRARQYLAPPLAAAEPVPAALELAAELTGLDYGAAAAETERSLLFVRLEREPMIEVRLGRARELRQRGHVADARELLEAGLRWDAVHPELRLALHSIANATGDIQRAREELEQLTTAYPHAGRFGVRLAEFAASRGELTRALAAIDRAILIAPDSEEFRRKRGEYLHLLGRREAALSEFEQALSLEPNQPRLREHVELLKQTADPLQDRHRLPTEELIADALAREETLNESHRVLLDNTVVEIQQDGTTNRYRQLIVKIINDRGIRGFDVHAIPFAFGEEWVDVTRARVHRPDGRRAEARIRNREPEVREGEYPLWSTAAVDLPPLERGDVVELEYRQEDLRQSFFGDYFGDRVVFAQTVPVDRVIYAIVAPEGRPLHFHARHLEIEPEVTRENERTTWRWELRDVAKIDPEPAMPPLEELAPRLEVSTFESWDSFADWYYHLVRRQFSSSEQIRTKVAELTEGLDGRAERIRAIYEFVVTEVRYIAWEFGIHGFKPYDAPTIFTRRFGDCKDKATLMCTMLADAGIEAWPVLIRASRARPIEDFGLPLMLHFNHCIVCVPDAGDGSPLFLDGTAEHHPATELPMMDRGARVLVVGESQGELAALPWNRPDEQRITERARVVVAADGSARVVQHDEFAGDYAVSVRSSLEIAAQRAVRLERMLGGRFPGVDVEKVETSALADLGAPVTVDLEMRIPDYLDRTGDGIKLPPIVDLFDSGATLARRAARETRQRDLLLGNPLRSELEVEIELPPGHEVTHLPAPVDIDTRHLGFEYRASVRDGRIVVRRRLELRAPRVTAADYESFKQAVDEIRRSQTERIVLRTRGEVD